MATAEQEVEEELLVDERDSEMVSLTGSQLPIKRTAWFLRPTADDLGPEAPPPRWRCKPNSHQRLKVLFRGWFFPQPQWRQWVDKLSPIYGHLWKKAGVFDAIQASTFVVLKDPCSITAAVRFWIGDTNSFHFAWSEATITLEDVTVLGGFSVLGEPVRSEEPLTGEHRELELKMVAERRVVRRSNSKKDNHASWMKHFIGGEADETEHIAFLSLWLSRFVFPQPVVRWSVFPIAVRIARGARIALAPAVLASLYRDMRVMRNHAGNRTPLQVWAPLQILQLWLWERFVPLRPAVTNRIDRDEPRAARWHNVNKRTDRLLLLSVLRSPDHFQWRPYTIGLDNWRIPDFYDDNGGWFCSNGGATGDEALGTLLRCLRACELVGLDCIEQYLPHRVAMQFGLDQDVPGSIPRANSSWVIAWDMYDVSEKKARLYVPPRLFESDVTCKYAAWWKQCENVSDGEKGKELKKCVKMIEGKKGQELKSQSKIKWRSLQDIDESTLPCLHSLQNSSPYLENKPEPKLKLPLEPAKNVNDPLDTEDEEIEEEANAASSSWASTKVQMEETEESTELVGEESDDQIDRQNREIEKEIELTDASDFSCNSTATFKIEDTEESNELVGKEPDDQSDMQNMKTEKEIDLTNASDSSCKSTATFKIEGTEESGDLRGKESDDQLDKQKKGVHKEIEMANASDSLRRSAVKFQMEETMENNELVRKEPASKFNRQDKGIERETKMTNASDSSWKSAVKFQKEKNTEQKDKGSKLDMEIMKLKEEIAALQAEIADLESQAEVHSE